MTDETLNNDSPASVVPNPVRVARGPGGRLKKGVVLNPKGYTGPRQITAQQMIDALYQVKGKDALTVILKKAFAMLEQGNTTLLCKILDKILPSKTETKTDLTVTHREEFIRMRARAMEILESYKARAN